MGNNNPSLTLWTLFFPLILLINGLELPIQTKKIMIQATETTDPSTGLTFQRLEWAKQISPKYDIPLVANPVEYYTTISIGYPPQSFTVQVDTGSSLTAIPALGCTSCNRPEASFDPSLSSSCKPLTCDCGATTKACANGLCLFSISYGDKSSIVGSLYRDSISFGNYSQAAKGVGFGAIMGEQPPHKFQAGQVGGILGLAYATHRMTCLPNCVLPVFDEFVAQLKIPNIFSLKLGLTSGMMTMGSVSDKLVTTPIFYTPIKEETYYVVALQSLSVGDSEVYQFSQKSGLTVVDSGTTFMVLPTDIASAVQRIFQKKYCHLPFICTEINIFTPNTCFNLDQMNSTVLAAMPNITVVLEDLKLTLQPQFYMQKVTTGTGECSTYGIMDGGNSSFTILGDTFMRAFYVIFDRQNKRIGFVGPEGTLERVPSPPDTDLPYPLWAILIVIIPTLLLNLIIGVVMVTHWWRKRRGPYDYSRIVNDM